MKRKKLDFIHIGILFLICITSINMPSLKAQSSEPRFSINIKQADLKQFTKHIESLSQLSFVYGEEVKIKHPITIQMHNKTLQEILNAAFTGTTISYQIKGSHIILQIKKIKVTHKRFTISGYVTDQSSSETLIGANVLENVHQEGTSTNSYGFYSITLPGGSIGLNFSYLGYSTQKHAFILSQDTILNINLQDNNLLKEVVILSDKVEAGIKSTSMSAYEIPMTQIKNTPSLLGEADVLKTIQLMPGVQSGVDGSSGLYIRGGGPDQNLILLDGIPVYNIEHLFGFFSVFTPEAIKKVTLFKGSFPARFGGRLSSVVDIRSNDGDMRKMHGVVSVGLLATKINLEGPIIKDRTSFNISARRSYLDLLAKPFMSEDEKFSYYFYDLNAKINHKFSDKNRIFLQFYNGRDNYHFVSNDKTDDSFFGNKSSVDWGSTIASARWNCIFNNKLFSNTTIAYNNYLLDMNTSISNRENSNNYSYESKYKANYHSGIKDLSYKIDFDYNPTPNHYIKFGTEYLYHTFRPEVMTSRAFDKEYQKIQQDTIYHSISNSRIHAHEISFYAEDNFDLSSNLRMNAGFHFSTFKVQDKYYHSIQPRISLRYQVADHTILKASYTTMSQYVHLLSSAPISMPTDLWVPVTKNIKPMKAHQYSLGGYYTGFKGWELSVEAYYKNMHNVLEYKDGVSFLGSSSGWDSKVEMGDGRAMGIELMAQKTIGKTTGWLSYTLAKSDRKFKQGSINNGERFPYRYDRRHSANFVINHKFSDRIDIGASWDFCTGGTATIPEEITSIIRPEDRADSFNRTIETHDYIEHRNNYRLPSSHKLSISVNFNKKTKHGIRTWNISVYNLYNAMNPAFVYRKNSTTEDTTKSGNYYSVSNKAVIKKVTILPCIPSITYTYKF